MKLSWRTIEKLNKVKEEPVNLDYSKDVAALRDNLEKGTITKEQFNKELSLIQLTKLAYIVSTNGGHTPSKKEINKWKEMMGSITEQKDRYEASLVLKNREAFLNEIQKQVESKESPPPEPPSSE